MQGFSQLSESGGARLQIIPKVGGGKKGKFKANMNDLGRKSAQVGGQLTLLPPLVRNALGCIIEKNGKDSKTRKMCSYFSDLLPYNVQKKETTNEKEEKRMEKYEAHLMLG